MSRVGYQMSAADIHYLHDRGAQAFGCSIEQALVYEMVYILLIKVLDQMKDSTSNAARPFGS